jgi:LPXTG-motif cell wall-anchored protein
VAAVAPVAQPALPKAGRPSTGDEQGTPDLPWAPAGVAAAAASLVGLGLLRRRQT